MDKFHEVCTDFWQQWVILNSSSRETSIVTCHLRIIKDQNWHIKTRYPYLEKMVYFGSSCIWNLLQKLQKGQLLCPIVHMITVPPVKCAWFVEPFYKYFVIYEKLPQTFLIDTTTKKRCGFKFVWDILFKAALRFI